MTVVNVVWPPTPTLGEKVGGGLWPEMVELPGRAPPSEIEKGVDPGGGGVVVDETPGFAGVVLDRAGQLGTPGGQDVRKITLVEKTVVVDCVEIGTGSIVGS